MDRVTINEAANIIVPVVYKKNKNGAQGVYLNEYFLGTVLHLGWGWKAYDKTGKPIPGVFNNRKLATEYLVKL